MQDVSKCKAKMKREMDWTLISTSRVEPNSSDFKIRIYAMSNSAHNVTPKSTAWFNREKHAQNPHRLDENAQVGKRKYREGPRLERRQHDIYDK